MWEVLKRKPGYQIPRLRHGESISVKGNISRKGKTLLLDPDTNDGVVPLELETNSPGAFLPSYTDLTREVIDEIAYRLFGFASMHDFQHDVLERVLTGKKVLAIAATGGGKSECFILPAMLLPGITVVVAPLKSLMQDQYEQRICERYGLGNLVTYINGDVAFYERENRLRRLELGYYKLIYMTPEQLEREYVLNSLKNAHERHGIRYLALDEAHCISHWGHDFRPSYLNILSKLKNKGINPVPIALTATASPRVRQDICDELGLDSRLCEQGGDLYIYASNRAELNLIVRVMKKTDEKVEDIVSRLRQLLKDNECNDYPGAAIVFVPHAKNREKGKMSTSVEGFAPWLEPELNTEVAIYHGKMDDDSDMDDTDKRNRNRTSEQDRFVRGERAIMVATKGFGMGIDKPNIRLVLHRTPPANLEAYVQEAGRAGRDGFVSDVVLYYSPDKPLLEDNENENGNRRLGKSDFEIQEWFIDQRRADSDAIRIMCRFLKQVSGSKEEYRYFTSDDVIEFFDGEGHLWAEDHYDKNVKIVKRALEVLYNCRWEFQGKRIGFIESLQEAQKFIRAPEVKNAEAIVSSNHYFGEELRAKGFTPADFKEEVEKAEKSPDGLMNLAKRLNMSLNELNGFLRDIKNAESWKDPLLDFDGLFPLSVDEGGAKGWEILPGEALFCDEHELNQFIEDVIREHEQRKEHDRIAYNHLLAEYVGATNGSEQNKKTRGCLRNVMLGYLKTGEIVQGNNCLSCSRCVPNEQFEMDLDKRRSVVKRLGVEVVEILDEFEQLKSGLLDEAKVSKLWQIVEREEREGRGLRQYLGGWLQKIIEDEPSHQTAHYIQVLGMLDGQFTLSHEVLLHGCEFLCEHVAETELTRIEPLLMQAEQEPPNDLRLIAIQVKLYKRMNNVEQEAKACMRIASHAEASKEQIREAHNRLVELYSVKKTILDGEQYAYHVVQSARLAETEAEAMDYYGKVLPGWSAPQILDEIAWLNENAGSRELIFELVKRMLVAFPEFEVNDSAVAEQIERSLLELLKGGEADTSIRAAEWLWSSGSPTSKEEVSRVVIQRGERYVVECSPPCLPILQRLLESLIQSVSNDLKLQASLAQLYMRMGNNESAQLRWEIIADHPESDDQWRFKAHSELCKIHQRSENNQAPSDKWVYHMRMAGHFAPDEGTAWSFYEKIVSLLDGPMMKQDLEWIESNRPNFEKLSATIVKSCLTGNPHGADVLVVAGKVVYEPLTKIFDSLGSEERIQLVNILGKLDDPRLVNELANYWRLYPTKSHPVCAQISRALVDRGESVIRPLLKWLDKHPPDRQLSEWVVDLIKSFKSEKALNELRRALQESQSAPHPVVVDAMVQFGDLAVEDIFALTSSPVPEVREQAILSLEKIGTERAIKALVGLLEHQDEDVVDKAQNALTQISLPALDALMDAIANENVRERSVIILGDIGHVKAASSLLSAFGCEKDDFTRALIIEALGKIGSPTGLEIICKALLTDSSPHVRSNAAEALGRINRPKGLESLIRAATDQEASIRKQIALALGKFKDERAFKTLVTLLEDPDEQVRAAAAEALGEIGDPRAIEPLSRAAKDVYLEVQRRAKQSLDRLRKI